MCIELELMAAACFDPLGGYGDEAEKLIFKPESRFEPSDFFRVLTNQIPVKVHVDSTHNHISSIPNALVLFNPVIDNGPGGYGYERIGDAYKSFSPLHNIKNGASPTILFLGTNDDLIPVETAKYYQKVMEKVNSSCELHLYEGQGHGFFNYGNFEYYKKTVSETDEFLQSLGYLNKEPIIEIE